MPRYGLLCNIDPSTVSARTTDKDTLNVGVKIGQASPVVANTSDIKEGTILSWTDVITVNVLDASNAKKSGPYTIDFGQTLEGKIENDVEKYEVHNDSKAPRYGFQYTTVGGGALEVHQTFGGNDLVFTTQWYDPGSYPINLSPDFAVWFTSKATDKYTVSFVNTATKIIYCNLEGTWSLAGPHLFAAGTVVAISQGSGGYIIGQPHSQKGKGGSSLMAPPVGNSKTRRAISFSFGPLVLEGYIDTSSLEIGVDVSLFGIELGVLYGNLAEGVVLHVDLVVASGLVRLYLKHPDTATTQLRVLIDLKVSVFVQTEYVEDVLIMSW